MIIDGVKDDMKRKGIENQVTKCLDNMLFWLKKDYQFTQEQKELLQKLERKVVNNGS